MTEPSAGRTASWPVVILVTAFVAFIVLMGLLLLPRRALPLSLIVVFVVIVPVYAWWLDRSAPRASISVGRATPIDGIAPVALLIPLRRARPYAWALVSFSIAGVSFLTAADQRSPTFMTLFGCGAIAIGIINLVNRRRLGFEFTSDGLRSIGVVKDLYFPWSAIDGVSAEMGQTRKSMMILSVDGTRVRIGRYLGLVQLPWKALAQFRVGVSGLPMPEEALIELVERFRSHPEERGQLVGPAGVRAATHTRTVPLYAFAESDARWLRQLLWKSLLTFPIVAGGAYLVGLAAKALDPATRFPQGLAFALTFGAFLSPFFHGPSSRYRFIQELGCRRSLLFWLAPIALGIVALAVAAIAGAIGIPTG